MKLDNLNSVFEETKGIYSEANLTKVAEELESANRSFAAYKSLSDLNNSKISIPELRNHLKLMRALVDDTELFLDELEAKENEAHGSI